MDCFMVTSKFASHHEEYLGDDESEYYLKAGRLELNFQKFIKVTDSFWSYSTLSLLAEVGGYVGLFLGISLNQITKFIEKFFAFTLALK